MYAELFVGSDIASHPIIIIIIIIIITIIIVAQRLVCKEILQ